MKRCLVFMFIVGCGGPQYQLVPTKAENVIEVERTPGGFRGKVGIAADSEGSLKGCLLKRGDLEMRLDEGSFAAKPSAVYTASVVPMQAFGTQQLNYAQIRATEWAGANEAWANTLNTFGPALGSYLQGRNQLQMAKLQRPRLIEESVQAFIGGQLDEGALKELLPPDLVTDVMNRVERRLQDLEAQTRQGSVQQELMKRLLERLQDVEDQLKETSTKPVVDGTTSGSRPESRIEVIFDTGENHERGTLVAELDRYDPCARSTDR